MQDQKVAIFDALMTSVEDNCASGKVKEAMDILASARAMVVPE